MHKLSVYQTWRRLYLITQLVVIGAIVFVFIVGLISHSAADYYISDTLTKSNTIVWNVFLDFESRQWRDLAMIGGRPKKDLEENLVDQVREKLNYSVAVFSIEDQKVSWLSNSDEVTRIGAPTIEADMKSILNGSRNTRIDTIGTTLLQVVYRKPSEAKSYVLALYHTSGDTYVWGVVSDNISSWRAFWGRLTRAKGAIEMEPIGRMLRSELQLAPSQTNLTEKTGCSVYITDEQVFTTQGLNISRPKYEFLNDDIRIDYYLSDRDQGYANIVRRRPFLIGIEALLIGLVIMMYRVRVWMKALVS